MAKEQTKIPITTKKENLYNAKWGIFSMFLINLLEGFLLKYKER